jgi:DNA-binding transcriptional regulator YiaG
MKPRKIQEMIRAKQRIETGPATPASVWELRPDGKGGLIRKRIDPKVFQSAQRAAWKQTIPAARRKLGLSQEEFARLLGISVRTLHHWEQGTRRPTGAARVLLRLATQNPEAVLAAAA